LKWDLAQTRSGEPNLGEIHLQQQKFNWGPV